MIAVFLASGRQQSAGHVKKRLSYYMIDLMSGYKLLGTRCMSFELHFWVEPVINNPILMSCLSKVNYNVLTLMSVLNVVSVFLVNVLTTN